jgi:hypothetical protein
MFLSVDFSTTQRTRQVDFGSKSVAHEIFPELQVQAMKVAYLFCPTSQPMLSKACFYLEVA